MRDHKRLLPLHQTLRIVSENSMTLNRHAPSSGSDWGRFLIYFLWVECIFLFFLGICKIMKRYCLPFYEDPTFLFRRRSQRRLLDENMDGPPSQLQSGGLASRVIHSLPALQFRNETESGANSSLQSSSDCAVCLGEFFEGEWLRMLPNCSHVFHVSCIDTWFRSHSSCPLCRANVVDDPSSLPIAPETLQREGMHSERHPYGLLEILLDEDRARSREIWLRATTPSRLGSDSDESFSRILPPVGGLVNPYSAEALIRLAHNLNGEPSSWELDSDGHTVEASNGVAKCDSRQDIL